MSAQIINSRNKVTLVFEVFTDGPNANNHLRDVCRGNDNEYIESALQVALSELSLISMGSLDVTLTAVHGGNVGPIYEKYKNG